VVVIVDGIGGSLVGIGDVRDRRECR
jgi:hypothetical protein